MLGGTAKSKKDNTPLQTAAQRFVKAICGLTQKLLRAAIREDLRKHGVYLDLPLTLVSRLVQNKVIIFSCVNRISECVYHLLLPLSAVFF
jgi:hypothetical protein